MSHVDAYARNSAAASEQPRESSFDGGGDEKRLKYAKLLAHKRLNDASRNADGCGAA